MIRLWPRWLVATVVGLAAALAYWLYWLEPTATAALERALVPVYLAAVFVGLAYWLLFGPAGVELRRASRRARWGWAAIATVGAAAVVAGVPIRPPAVPRTQLLEVVATGAKNSASQGSEVWLNGLDLANGTSVPASDFQLVTGWQLRNGLVMSQDGQPATLRWQGTTSGDARLRLLTHGWSGVAQVRWNGGEVRTLDLYSTAAGEAVVPLSHGSDAAQPYTASQIAALLAITISLAALIYIVGGIALAASRRRPRLTPRPQPGDESTR